MGDIIDDPEDIIAIIFVIGIGILLIYIGAINYNLGLIIVGILFILLGGALIAIMIFFGGLIGAVKNKDFSKK